MNFRYRHEACEMMQIYNIFKNIAALNCIKKLSIRFNIPKKDIIWSIFLIREYFLAKKVFRNPEIRDSIKQLEPDKLKELKDTVFNIVLLEQFIFCIDKSVLIENITDFFTFPRDIDEELENIIINAFRAAGIEFGLKIRKLEKGYFIYWDKYHSNKYGLKDYGIKREGLMIKNKGDEEKCNDQIRRILK